jgi:hypothetical protein
VTFAPLRNVGPSFTLSRVRDSRIRLVFKIYLSGPLERVIYHLLGDPGSLRGQTIRVESATLATHHADNAQRFKGNDNKHLPSRSGATRTRLTGNTIDDFRQRPIVFLSPSSNFMQVPRRLGLIEP